MKISEKVENVRIQIKYAQYYMTFITVQLVNSYEHTIPILENVSLSSLILLRNGFVLGTNI